MKKMRNNKGFSLLEVAIVIAVIAILAAVAVPMVGTMFEDADAELVRTTVADIELTVSNGLSRGVPITTLASAAGITQIIGFVQAKAPATIQLATGGSSQIVVNVLSKGNVSRSVTIQIQANGDISFVSETGFPHYNVSGTDLVKT